MPSEESGASATGSGTRTRRRRAVVDEQPPKLPKLAPRKRPPAKRKAKAKAPAKRGQPTKYRPEHCQAALDAGRKGKSVAGIAAELDVDRATIYNWMDKHPDFFDAVKRSRDLALGWWENVMQGQANGVISGNATAMIFALKNQFPDDYRDRREHAVETQGTLVIDFMGADDDYIDVDQG